jgi:hypothetical protein
MKRRCHITLKTKLASALLALGHVPYDDAKQMTEDQIISLYHFDHGILHAVEPVDDYWNLTPRLISEHREKSRKDTSTVAKVKRISAREDARAELARCREIMGRIDTPTKPTKRKWPSRKIPSRPFRQSVKTHKR